MFLPLPSDDYTHYFPEPAYFHETAGFPFDLAMQITAQQVAQWADRYNAYPLTPQGHPLREGLLPLNLQERDDLIIALFAWLRSAEETPYLGALNLFREGHQIFRQHDGLPGIIVANVEQFALLQQRWVQHGLPSDLYFANGEWRAIVEPMDRHGGVVLEHRLYSPHQWIARKSPVLTVPTEEERRTQFAESCRAFMTALGLRIAQLREPGTEADRNEAHIHRLLSLMGEVARAMQDERTRSSD
jgi:hypothetical protein